MGGKMLKSTLVRIKKLIKCGSNKWSSRFKSLKHKRTLRRTVKQQAKLSLRLQNLDLYLAELPQVKSEPIKADAILARAGIFYEMVKTEGWRDTAARTKAMLEGLRRDLERNPFDPKTGRDRSDELRAMIFGMQRVLDVPRRAINSADALHKALVRQGDR